MDRGDSELFTRRLVSLGELFDVDLSPAKQALYFEALQDLPFSTVVEALNEAAKVCKFFPKPAELRELGMGNVEDRAAEAWVEFRQEMRRVGAYIAPLFQAVTAYAITDTFGTWPAACAADLSPEMWASKRKEFLHAYRRHMRYAHDYPLCLTLAGAFEIERGLPAMREESVLPVKAFLRD